MLGTQQVALFPPQPRPAAFYNPRGVLQSEVMRQKQGSTTAITQAPTTRGRCTAALAWFPVLASSPQHLYWLGLHSHQGNLVSLMLFSKEMQFKNSQPPNSNFCCWSGNPSDNTNHSNSVCLSAKLPKCCTLTIITQPPFQCQSLACP